VIPDDELVSVFVGGILVGMPMGMIAMFFLGQVFAL
jgi:hypothetical protein